MTTGAVRFASLALLALSAPAVASAAPTAEEDAAAIRQVMDDSAKAWSAGDLAGFMQSYERGPDTTFVTSSGLVKGYDAIADRYRAHYGAGGPTLGALTFDVLEIDALGFGYAVLYGRYHLVRSGRPKEDTGVFDLILHKGPKGWRILSDHTG